MRQIEMKWNVWRYHSKTEHLFKKCSSTHPNRTNALHGIWFLSMNENVQRANETAEIVEIDVVVCFFFDSSSSRKWDVYPCTYVSDSVIRWNRLEPNFCFHIFRACLVVSCWHVVSAQCAARISHEYDESNYDGSKSKIYFPCLLNKSN